jgi:phage antirepressor YoqD-like protein
MTVREVAEYLGCNPETVKGHIRDMFPNIMENGKTTYLNEAQITVILERIKKTTSEHRGAESVNLQRSVVGIETTHSRAFRIELLHKQIEAELNAEIAELKAENAGLAPKAAYHDALIAHDHLTNFRDTAKELGIPEKQFIQTLIDKGYIYRSIRGDIKPYHDKMKWFSMKDWESNGHTGARTLITVEGKKRFMAVFGTCEQKRGAEV